VSTYANPDARRLDDPNTGGIVGASHQWITPFAYRGIGNVLIVVSPDPNVRYRVLLGLDELLPQQL